MNKSELIGAIAHHSKLNKTDAARALNGLTKTIESALKKGHPVSLAGFGSFEVKDRAERKGRNPQTGQDITIAAAKVPNFKAGKALKDAVKG
ncbi:MAG: HU family DNA-binding protein [Methylobacter sp.]|nr:HU family DNA-binding protein [Methylobacter sp.]